MVVALPLKVVPTAALMTAVVPLFIVRLRFVEPVVTNKVPPSNTRPLPEPIPLEKPLFVIPVLITPPENIVLPA